MDVTSPVKLEAASGHPGVTTAVTNVKHVNRRSLDREEHFPGRAPAYQHLADLDIEGSAFPGHRR